MTLESRTGNIVVVQPSSGDALMFTDTVILRAADNIDSYRFFIGSKHTEYRAGQTFDFSSSTSSIGLPASISAATLILEQGEGLKISSNITINATRVELITDANVFISGQISGSISQLAITARGTRTVTAQAYNEATGSQQTVTEPTGDINIQSSSIAGAKWEFRAAKDVYIELQNSFEVVGFVGGVTGFTAADSVWVKTPNTVTLRGGIISGDRVQIDAGQVNSNVASVVLAKQLFVTASGNITLSTASDEITAESTGTGSIVLNEADSVVLQHVVVNNGSIQVTAGGNLTAEDVRAMTDGAGKDIVLKANGMIYVNSVDAGVRSGMERSGSEVLIDAYQTIREPVGKIDNEPAEGASFIDVFAWKITLKTGTALTAPKLIASDSDRGTGSELEVIYTAGTGGVTQGSTTMTGSSVPSSVSGDYVLVAPNHSGPLTLSVSGTLVIVQLPTSPGMPSI
ncbi:MAG UNVERIFIED_CONTAM: hypothetical protein LVR18_45770 [Planctomycetaceae bacterium]